MEEIPDLVLVEWRDAASHDDPEADEIGTVIYSAGFLIKETRRGIRLADSFGHDVDWRSVLDIPKPYIISIVELGPAL